jgi:16S rRNA C967 or C1407 C5-methylase (RsmB/RsmF family)/NOL1/NOP2/fmu family ribosome biogenesis protein
MLLPTDFLIRTGQWLDDCALLERALEGVPPVSVRLNRAKLPSAATALDRVPWCATGYYLAKRPAFTFDPMLHGGAYYVQEASSMFLEQAVRQHAPSAAVCLDLCAAPGGKSTHLLSLLPDGSVLVCNEMVGSRRAALMENVAKWGAANVFVTGSGAAEMGRLTHVFDLIVADMPCSGEGMFRRDVRSRSEWSVARVGMCAERQRQIVHGVWEALRPGGLLVYSTCTFNREENEDNVRHIVQALHAEALPLAVDDAWGVCRGTDGALPSYRFFPHRARGEGFFLAVLRKPDGPRRRVTAGKDCRAAAARPAAHVRGWLRRPEAFRFATFRDALHAVPDHAAPLFALLAQRLHLCAAGVCVGQVRGRDMAPSHALALSTELNGRAFPSVDVPRDEALRYLRCETPVPPAGVPKGPYLVTFRRLPLGFARHTGLRVNNLYPHGWRIRSGGDGGGAAEDEIV